MICILGPTATGKTQLAVYVAAKLNGEIISADSRQVYRKMDLGTGKDLDEYQFNGIQVPYHLIDIVDAGAEYNVYEYQKDFLQAYNQVVKRDKTPILCGGSGMYIEAVLKGYKLIQVPINESLRQTLEAQSNAELVDRLKSFKKLHNKTDIESRHRLIRAIEIEEFYTREKDVDDFPHIKAQLFGVVFDRHQIRKRITERLKQRLNNGMIEEIENLLKQGIGVEKLKYYGLEYKFIAMYLNQEISYNDMFQKLNSAIHQFAKRQMTWFRKMQRDGSNITWIDGYLPIEKKWEIIKKQINK